MTHISAFQAAKSGEEKRKKNNNAATQVNSD